MQKQTHHQRTMSTRIPTWLRYSALLCLLLLSVGSVAQVCHSHNETPLSSHGKLHDTQVDCQLCVAMHSLLVVPSHQAPVPVGSTLLLSVSYQQIHRIFLWRAALASRPPPATASLITVVQEIV